MKSVLVIGASRGIGLAVVSRADVADFIVAQLDSRDHVHSAPVVIG